MSKLTYEEKKSLPDKCFTFIGVINGVQRRKLPVFDESGTIMPAQLRAALSYLPKTILPSESIRREIHDKLENLLVKYHSNIKSGKRTTYHGWKPVSGITVKRNPDDFNFENAVPNAKYSSSHNRYIYKLSDRTMFVDFDSYNKWSYSIGTSEGGWQKTGFKTAKDAVIAGKKALFSIQIEDSNGNIIVKNPHEPTDTFDRDELMRIFNEFTNKNGKKNKYSEYELYDAMEHCIRVMGANADFKSMKYRNHLGKNWLKYLADEEGKTAVFNKRDIIDSIYHAWDERAAYENAKARLK